MKKKHNIFYSENNDGKKQNIKKIKNITVDSGYLHDWKEQRKSKRSIFVKRFGVFFAALTVTVLSVVFGNVQELKRIQRQREEYLAQITQAPVPTIQKETPEPADYSDEFEYALRQYQDVVGYLKIDDTNIDFPIVQGEDNYFYENRNYDRTYSDVAATYMLTECDPKITRHLIIYGENEDIDGRLGELEEFLDHTFFMNHEYITLELEEGSQIWQVFSVHLASLSFDYKDIVFETNTEYLAYINMFKTMSRFEREITLTERDQVLTLVTNYHDLDLQEGYLMVHAKRIN
ncbi:MAG: class B sortase [Eubacteriales bacterium]